MKILAIRLENLASLAGRHELDFTRAPLAEQGLFAITGPTGAGKSTLLDALCLALYGNTPRLRLAPSRESQLPDASGESLTTADARTLLRRGCTSGYAEVDFEGRDGHRYRARWAVRRARDRIDGRLQAAEQSLTELDSDRVLTAQKREFDRLLPERLGLSFEQFTRAVLLAQSEFAAFLKADDNARSDLLEKLTDTDVYSRISVAAFRRSREAQQVVRELEQRLSGDAPATDEARAELEREAADSERELAEQQARVSRLRVEQQWLDQDDKLGQSVATAVHRHDQACQAEAALAPLYQQERDLERLAPQRHHFLRRRELDRQCRELETQLTHAGDALANAETACTTATQTHEQAQARLDEAERERQHAQPLIETTREQAARLDHHERTHREKMATRQRIDAELTQVRQQHADLLATSERQRHELQVLESALGEQLGEHPDGLAARRALQTQEDRAGQRRLALSALQQEWRQWRQAEQRMTALQRQQQTDQDEHDALLNQGKAAATELERLEREQQQLQASIERLRVARSAQVAQLRQQLLPDHPCPVCGSQTHPYRHAPPVEPAQAMLDATIREEDHQLETIAAQVASARERHHTLQGEYRALKSRMTQTQQQLAQLQQDLAAQKASLGEHEQGSALLEIGDDGEHWLEAQRRQAEQQWQSARQALEVLETTQQRIEPLRQTMQTRDVELGRLASRCEHITQQLAALDAEITPLDATCQHLRETLKQALGTHVSPQAWQQAIDSALEQARQQERQAQTQRQHALSERQSRQHALESTRERHAALDREREDIVESCQAWRRANPDIDDDRLDTLLAVDEAQRHTQRQRLQAAERERHTAEVSLEERRLAWCTHRRERFGELPEADLLDEATASRIAELRQQVNAQETALVPRLDAAQQRRDTALHALHDDDRRRRQQQALNMELEQARREQYRWGSISELIGSADGKAFRRIAQAYNLEQLLEHANAHLATLSRRYRLARGGSELGLLVVDGDMGDERRSVHSLSGGETFLVSLALALGLASMASGQLRIDSLFIDEGFGSLDPQSLAVAMEALDGLQAQGRRVGVISHVQEMHERIPLQVQVEPLGNGASRLNVTKGLLR
ncbi:AAA family ATPase [Modicisalibacter xianhensis]|uniref:Nuclease SbcCD subunit C n=1 Tax=Modicisalibacter xianhensis TaxID=442341 RepID=A0A1I3G529_9GAMM|nr:AAA family ATPase [Halomonas xianhensis]SFI18615.1 exonuclease SbcC [Halomonas xianhensis]